MFHTEYIQYLKRENKSNFEEAQNYYLQRKLKRFIQIDKKLFSVVCLAIGRIQHKPQPYLKSNNLQPKKSIILIYLKRIFLNK